MSDATNETTQVAQRCLPWQHQYTKWEDVDEMKKLFKDRVVGIGIQQGRRCVRCGRLQLRVVWAVS